MRLDLYKVSGPGSNRPDLKVDVDLDVAPLSHVIRAEVPLIAPDDSQYKVILLDADDSFDVIIHHPNGDREAIWSLVKGHQE